MHTKTILSTLMKIMKQKTPKTFKTLCSNKMNWLKICDTNAIFVLHAK